jgi:hypothetical protein
MRKLGMLLGATALLALVGGCSSSDTYDRTDFVSSLEENGVPSDQANCIADGIEGRIDLDALEDRGELTEEQTAALTEITRRCTLAPSDTTVAGVDTTPQTQLETGEGGNDEG